MNTSEHEVRVMSDSLVSKAYRAVGRLDEAELRTHPIGVLKQVRGLMKRAKGSGVVELG